MRDLKNLIFVRRKLRAIKNYIINHSITVKINICTQSSSCILLDSFAFRKMSINMATDTFQWPFIPMTEIDWYNTSELLTFKKVSTWYYCLTANPAVAGSIPGTSTILNMDYSGMQCIQPREDNRIATWLTSSGSD